MPYSCFISYSSHDQGFAGQLYIDLRARGLRCWFASEDLKIGDRFQEQIEQSIMTYDKVMIVLSEESMKSHWVEREVNAAREREERQNCIVLFPIRIDDAIMNAQQPWAADIRRTRHVGDFSQWNTPDSYEKALERLVRDLISGGEASMPQRRRPRKKLKRMTSKRTVQSAEGEKRSMNKVPSVWDVYEKVRKGERLDWKELEGFDGDSLRGILDRPNYQSLFKDAGQKKETDE